MVKGDIHIQFQSLWFSCLIEACQTSAEISKHINTMSPQWPWMKHWRLKLKHIFSMLLCDKNEMFSKPDMYVTTKYTRGMIAPRIGDKGSQRTSRFAIRWDNCIMESSTVHRLLPYLHNLLCLQGKAKSLKHTPSQIKVTPTSDNVFLSHIHFSRSSNTASPKTKTTLKKWKQNPGKAYHKKEVRNSTQHSLPAQSHSECGVLIYLSLVLILPHARKSSSW